MCTGAPMCVYVCVNLEKHQKALSHIETGSLPCKKDGKEITLIQNLKLSSTDLKAISRQSAAHTATSSRSIDAIGLEPGFNSLMKNSLNVCPKRNLQDVYNYNSITKSKCGLQFKHRSEVLFIFNPTTNKNKSS